MAQVNKKTVSDALMALVRSELGDGMLSLEGRAAVTALSECGELDSLFRLAERHDVSAVLVAALVKAGIITHDSDEYQKRLGAEELAFLRAKRLDYAIAEIESVLTDAKIRHTPLKGAVMRPLYPSPIMRMSADIDILVSESELDRAVGVLTGSLGYRAEGAKGFHDVSLYSPEGIHLELHYNLKENEPTLDAVLCEAEEHIPPLESYTAPFSPEFFLFHLFTHLTYHFLNGGCGIKPFSDIYIYRKNNSIDAEKLLSLISRAALSEFYKNVCDLISVWFEGAPHTELTRNMEAHVLYNAYGGAVSRSVVRRQGKAGKLGYILGRIFMPYSQLKIRYPIVGKFPPLLPVFEVVRWVSLIFSGGQDARRELSSALAVTDAQVSEMREFLLSIGLE